MYRTHTCGELNKEFINDQVTLSGWVQRSRDLGGMTFIDLRDRYGITQLVFDMSVNSGLYEKARKLGREYVVRITGTVKERSNKNLKIPTGEIEIIVEKIEILSESEIPPFTIEDNTDGGDELRMKYRYLDLRREKLKNNMELRHKMARAVRNYLDNQQFIEIETPNLIKSTPEGARDFIVPSRMNCGEFYALPQSPQVLKQILMLAGYDRYYQIARCFRDEDLRSDRQPEFTQVDCEMAFVEQDDVLNTFEGLTKHLFKTIKGIIIKEQFRQMPYYETLKYYGTDKPDLRFDMKIMEITNIAKGKDFNIFNNAEYIGGICADQCSDYSRKQIDNLTKYVQRPQIGAKGIIYVKYNMDGSLSSSVDKFYDQESLKQWMNFFNAKKGDLLLILAGDKNHTLNALSELRLEMGNQLGLRKEGVFIPLWVTDFPLLEWDEKLQRYNAKHHPFTSPKSEDMELLDSDPGKVRANAYDLVINGVEIGGGSIRIHDNKLQKKMFHHLGFTEKQAEDQFGFLLNAFKFGAPPHGGIAFGFDRWVALFGGSESIRDFIAFPKNTSGRDVMMDSPSTISKEQLDELNLKFKK